MSATSMSNCLPSRRALKQMLPPPGTGSMPWRTAFSTKVSSIKGGMGWAAQAGFVSTSKRRRAPRRVAITVKYACASANSRSTVESGSRSEGRARRR